MHLAPMGTGLMDARVHSEHRAVASWSSGAACREPPAPRGTLRYRLLAYPTPAIVRESATRNLEPHSHSLGSTYSMIVSSIDTRQRGRRCIDQLKVLALERGLGVLRVAERIDDARVRGFDLTHGQQAHEHQRHHESLTHQPYRHREELLEYVVDR